ncbi:MAG: group II truncated hemoglobin [Mariprofundus sp.]|nr:group II truncated hemoglobin [Mariprofundus sp.]
MQFTSDARSFYERIGGEAPLRLLVLRFYHHMHALPETQGIRAMHQANLASAQDKLFMFLSGWMGGPSLYIEKFGHPRLRMRHMPFSIGESERDQWMRCMSHALEDSFDDKTLRDELYEALSGVADFMRNKS